MRSEIEAMRAENTRNTELLATSEVKKGEVEIELDSLKVEKADVDKQLKDLKCSSQMNEAMLKFGQSQLTLKLTQTEKKLADSLADIANLKSENDNLKQQITHLKS